MIKRKKNKDLRSREYSDIDPLVKSYESRKKNPHENHEDYLQKMKECDRLLVKSQTRFILLFYFLCIMFTFRMGQVGKVCGGGVSIVYNSDGQCAGSEDIGLFDTIPEKLERNNGVQMMNILFEPNNMQRAINDPNYLNGMVNLLLKNGVTCIESSSVSRSLVGGGFDYTVMEEGAPVIQYMSLDRNGDKITLAYALKQAFDAQVVTRDTRTAIGSIKNTIS